MPTYRAKFGDQIIPIEAESPEKAAIMARLRFAGLQGVSQAEAGAVERSNAPDLSGNPTQILAKSRERTAEGLPGYATPGALAVIGGAALPGMALGMAKDATVYGLAEGAEKMFGLPSFTGEAIGAISPARQAVNLGRRLLGGGALKAAGAEGVESTAANAMARAEREFAMKEAESAARVAERQARADSIKRVADARIAAIEARAAGKAVPRMPKAKPAPSAAPPTEGATALADDGAEFIDPSAVKVLPFPPAKGSVKPATNLGGATKPGPAATPPDELEETLRRSIEAAKAKKAGEVRGKSPLLDEALTNAEGMHQREATAGMTERVAARRKEVGSQVVARELGMERGQVQSDAGTILNEALGEVSPVIPSARWAEIVTKMKSLPPEDRVAYVAKARGVKNMAQIENLRRTLETLGLLLPVGVAASSVDQ